MNQTITIATYLQVLKIKAYTGDEAIVILQQIINYIRPQKKRNKLEAITNFKIFLQVLESDAIIAQQFYNLVATLIIDSNITDLLTDNGIITGATFAQQARRIINDKIIPPYHEDDDSNVIFQKIFAKKWDYIWLQYIPNEQLSLIINPINAAIHNKANDITTELCNAAKLVSYRIASLGLEKEILIRANKKEELITAFTQQNTELVQFLKLQQPAEKEEALIALRTSLIQCSQSLRQLEKNSIETGTSINQTFLLRRLNQNVNRLKFILSFLQKNKSLNTISVAYFLKDALQYLKTKNNLRNFISNNLNLLAYRIVDHTKDTGENYITSTRTDYWKMFLAACGGGFVVSLLVMVKFKIGTLHLPLFWEGFLFSLNYAIGFIAIQLSGFTLATKQPAMTASTLANSLKGSSRNDFVQMSILISRVCRTQFISILGNICMVIPFTILWLLIYDYTSDTSYLSADAAHKQLIANHPYYSYSFLFAAVAGVFLFVSGLVSGYVENRMVYAKIPERLQYHALLKRVLPKKWLTKFIHLLTIRSGAIFGNLTLGICLGMASFFGKIFGIQFDIRHITFAAGNVSMGIYGGGTQSIQLMLECLGCIFIIGITNLLVSFSLAFYIAIKARNLHLADYSELTKMVIKHFLTTPREFFIAPKGGRSKFAAKQDQTIYTTDLGI